MDTKSISFSKSLAFIFIIIISYSSIAFSIENKIVLRVDNEIITSIDIYDEANYLKALNPNLKNLDYNKLIRVAKTSLIREKIKEIEILKYKKNQVDEKYLDNLIKNIYLNIGLKDREEFQKYINSNSIDMSTIKKKLSYEALWNQIIYNKFYSKLKIDKEKVKEDIKRKKNKFNSYLLYEIIYNADEKVEAEKLFNKIKASISKDGFQNTAAIYSVSESSKTGGKLGWIDESSMNKKILNHILKLEIGDHTNPILIPGGFLILSLMDRKKIEKKIDIEKELALKIRSLQNEQLNQYSNIYYKKIKKDVLINEK